MGLERTPDLKCVLRLILSAAGRSSYLIQEADLLSCDIGGQDCQRDAGVDRDVITELCLGHTCQADRLGSSGMLNDGHLFEAVAVDAQDEADARHAHSGLFHRR